MNRGICPSFTMFSRVSTRVLPEYTSCIALFVPDGLSCEKCAGLTLHAGAAYDPHHMPAAILRSLSPWDLVLFVVVTAMGTLLAYVPDPRWKAMLLGLPLPFTVTNLSLGQPVGPSHALAMAVLLLFMNLVRWIYARAPIVVAVVLSVMTYIGIALALNRLIPNTPLFFWCSLAFTSALAGILLAVLPVREEPSYRSPLSLAPKVAAIAVVVALIVILKQALGGFMTVFPMVGTIAAYEARHSLWTMARQIPLLMVSLGPMMATMWLAQNLLHASVPLSLLIGWPVFLAIIVPATRAQFLRGRPPGIVDRA